ncbi:unnamed protein product, partial [Prorocentrum cordatum]
DYLRRARASGAVKSVDFALLAEGDPRVELLLRLEQQAEARRLLDDMALGELQELLCRIQEAFQAVHGPGCLPPSLELWASRLQRPGDPLVALHPSEVGELSAALQEFLQQNRRAVRARELDALPACVARALSGPRAPLAGSPGGLQLAQGAARRVVACFGGGEGPCPVVVRSVPLGLAGAEEDYEVRELGLRVGGMYRAVPHSHCDDPFATDGAALLHFEWVPPGEVREDSRPLEQALSGATHVRLRLPGGSGPDEPAQERQVNLQTNSVQSESAWYRAIPSRVRTGADAEGGFRRFVLEVGRGLRLPLPVGLLQAAPGCGVAETADVLAQVLALWFSQRHAPEDVASALRRCPELLYFASTALFQCFDHLSATLLDALRRHWAAVLRAQADPCAGRLWPSEGSREAQDIILELLVVRPGGRHCAVLPPSQLGELCRLVDRTKHSVKFLAVESFCFESALEKIGELQRATMTFLVVDVTGQVSAPQLGELVRHAQGSVRLVLQWYHGLLPALAATRSLGRVIVPESVAHDLSTQVSPVLYRESFALGQATLRCAGILHGDPAALSPLADVELCPGGLEVRRAAGGLIDWPRNLAGAQRLLAAAHAWAQSEAEWRACVPAGQRPRPHEALLLLVAPDEAPVRRHYEGLPSGAGVLCLSMHHSDRQALAQVEALLDGAAVRPGSAVPAGPAGSACGVLVLFGVGFVSPATLEGMVARAFLGGQRVVLVVQEPISVLRAVRIMQMPAAVRALRLVLGPAAVPSEQHVALSAAVEAEDLAACLQIMKVALKAEACRDLLGGILAALSPGGQADGCDPGSLAFAVGCLAAAFVQRSAALGLDEGVWHVSFPDFRAHVPVCRFLDQASVLEAWCRYLDLVGASPGASEGGGGADAELGRGLPERAHVPGCVASWPGAEPHRLFVGSQWLIACNAHSPGIEGLLEHATAMEGGDGSAADISAPMYYSSGSGHYSEAQEEVLERHCLQCRELDWAYFSESWRTALDIKPDVFLRLAAFGVDTLRLFLCLPPERAIELGLTHLLDAAGRGGTPQARLAAVVAQKLLLDVECAAPLLEAAAREGPGEVAPRLAAVKWLLLTALPESEALSMLSGVGRIHEAAVQQLVRAKVMLCPRGRDELRRRVVSIVVGLDGGDILASQHDVRRFLLETTTPLRDLLCDGRARVGRAIVSFLFCPDHTERLKRGEAGRAITESFAHMFGFDVLRWSPLHGAPAAEPHRVTPAAHAAALERSPGPAVARALAGGPLLGAVCRLAESEGIDSADAFLCEVLDCLPMGCDNLVLIVLETLACPGPAAAGACPRLGEEAIKGILRSAANPFLPRLFEALRARSLGGYLALVASYARGDAGRPLRLALDASPALQQLYVEHFRGASPGDG